MSFNSEMTSSLSATVEIVFSEHAVAKEPDTKPWPGSARIEKVPANISCCEMIAIPGTVTEMVSGREVLYSGSAGMRTRIWVGLM